MFNLLLRAATGVELRKCSHDPHLTPWGNLPGGWPLAAHELWQGAANDFQKLAIFYVAGLRNDVICVRPVT